MATSIKNQARDAAIRQMHKEGKTLRDIAAAFGLTHQRIYQIVTADGTSLRQFNEAAGRPDRSLYFKYAHRYVDAAVRNGDLPKLDGSILCADCSNPATEYDHRDYKRPLEVDPVCRACNAARGPGLHRDPSETGTKPLSIRKRFDLKAA
jgi:hypothetical protein